MGQILFAPSGAGVTSDDVTATKAQVLSGYTALTKDSNDDPISGTMTNRGAWTSSSSGSGKITVPAGYHNGSGYVDCSGAYNKGVTDADNRTNTNSASYNSGKQAVLGGCRIERISMSQYDSHSGTKTFGSNGYIYVAGVLMHGKQVYSGKTATCKVTLNGGIIAQCSATTEDNFGDNPPGYSSFSTNFVKYYANNNITASVTGDNGRMACDVFIVFIPD